jgi:Tol biopolymer transport system component
VIAPRYPVLGFAIALVLSGCGANTVLETPGQSSSPKPTQVLAPSAAAATAVRTPTPPSAPTTPPPSLASTPSSTPFPSPLVTPAPSEPPITGTIAFSLWFGPTADVGTNLYTIGANGTGLRQLTHLKTGCNRDPAWLPDGRIVFDIGLPATVGCDSSTSEYLASMNANGGSIHRLTSVPDSVFDDGAAVSPDGSKIVFSRFDISGAMTGLWLMNADGSDLVRVTTTPPEDLAGGDQSPSFSPDGKTLIFARDRGDNRDGSIYTVGVDGSGLKQIIPESADVAGPRFSPDGTKILFCNLDTSPVSVGQNIFVANPDGSGVVSLTQEQSPSSAGDAAWSPDGRRIVFKRYQEGDHYVGLVVMNADGSDPILIWNPTPGTDQFPGGPVWADV